MVLALLYTFISKEYPRKDIQLIYGGLEHDYWSSEGNKER